MRINTGHGTISLLTWASIISISLLINLPGLAVSPMLPELHTIFPNTTELEEQLLTLAPNLLIIPFILLSGLLSTLKHKKPVILLGLIIFAASTILYFFADTMGELIVYSCTLGIGCGLLIPFATGLIADTFSGSARMRQLGLSSALSNFMLVIATFAVGFLVTHNWHLPFLVYLICIIPLALIAFLPSTATVSNETEQDQMPEKTHEPVMSPGKRIVKGFYLGRALGVTGLYFFMCFLNGAVIYYLQYLMVAESIPHAMTAYGTVTSLFYLAIFLPGMSLPWVLRTFRNNTYLFCGIAMLCGIALIILCHNVWCIGLGAILMGLSYGVYQPVSFDKATAIVNTPKLNTLSLAIVMTANYVAVAAAAPIIDGLKDLFGCKSDMFPFYLDFVLMAIFMVIYLFRRHTFSLSTIEYDEPAAPAAKG